MGEDVGAAEGEEKEGSVSGEGVEEAESAEGAAAEGEASDAAAAEEETEEGVAGGGAVGQAPWTFPAFDADGDGAISEAEFEESLFAFVSAGAGEAGLESITYLSAVETFGLNQEQFSLVKVDANDDGSVGKDEFGDLASAAFDRWDANNDDSLAKQEFASGMFVAFDNNEDGVIAAEELEDYAFWFASGLDLEQVAGGGGAGGGFSQDFFLTGDMTMVEPQEAEAGEPGDAGAMPGQEEEQEEDAPGEVGEQGAPGDVGVGGEEDEADEFAAEGDEIIPDDEQAPGEVGEQGAPGDVGVEKVPGAEPEGGDAGQSGEAGDQ
ncbi:MAG TPA: hypothetical protein VF168_14970 [Trueperaceae bacterium]